MKQEIDPKDIRPGDLIREERNPESARPFSALEFTATERTHLPHEDGVTYYLLNRPFTPHWGMVVGSDNVGTRAVYLPSSRQDPAPWMLVERGCEGLWTSSRVIKDNLDNRGWKIVEKPVGIA